MLYSMSRKRQPTEKETERILRRKEFAAYPCPCCNSIGLKVEYGTFGTELHCNECQGTIIMCGPPFEVLALLKRADNERKKTLGKKILSAIYNGPRK
jgi:hypothetical protein